MNCSFSPGTGILFGAKNGARKILAKFRNISNISVFGLTLLSFRTDGSLKGKRHLCMKAVTDAERIRLAVISGGLDCLDRLPIRTVAPAQAMSERRSEPRFPVVRDVTLRVWMPPDFEIIAGQVRDISRSGVGVITPSYVPPGSEIEFRVGDFQVFAEVRHCRRSATAGFVLGAKINDVVLPDGQHCKQLGE